MELIFVTGNIDKFREAEAMLHGCIVRQESCDLPEIQSLDPHEVVRAKAESAFEKFGKPLFVEDVSLVCYALGQLPGPFIKWFLDDLGADGLAELVHKYDRHSAKAQCTIGYADKKGKIHIIDGIVNGTIVVPRGIGRFGFDPIFMPERGQYTFAQMTLEEKNSISHRGVALVKFRNYIQKN